MGLKIKCKHTGWCMAFYLHFYRAQTLLIHAWKNNDARSSHIISENTPSGHTNQGEARLYSKPLHVPKYHTCWKCKNKHGLCVSQLRANQGRFNSIILATHKVYNVTSHPQDVYIQLHILPSFLRCSYLKSAHSDCTHHLLT